MYVGLMKHRKWDTQKNNLKTTTDQNSPSIGSGWHGLVANVPMSSTAALLLCQKPLLMIGILQYGYRAGTTEYFYSTVISVTLSS